ncbi:MAG TPA: DUF2171 domain-containing protein [Thermomicrobiales bacterium]|nr:DUF2171 domain-containing protein [Thermomicrobiales bacterium]
MSDTDLPHIPAGVPVVDIDGDAIGTIRAVYPHYIAVEQDGIPPAAHRVPPHAVASFDGAKVTLNVGRDALDEMTPEAEAAIDLPRHGDIPEPGDREHDV